MVKIQVENINGRIYGAKFYKDGTLIGDCIYLNAGDSTGYILLMTFHIKEEFRRKGLGTKCVNEFRKLYPNKGITGCFLYCIAKSFWNSLADYCSSGEVGEFEFKPLNN